MKKTGVVIICHYFKCIVQYIQFSCYISGNRMELYINWLPPYFLFVDRDILSVFEAKFSSFLHMLAWYLFTLLIMCFSYMYSSFFWNYTLKLRYYHLEEYRKEIGKSFFEEDKAGSYNQLFCKALVRQLIYLH